MKPALTLRMPSGSWPRYLAAAGLLLALGLAACGKTGPAGEAGADGVNTDSGITTGTTLTAADNAPGVVLNITSVTGGSGPGGNFKVGDTPSVTFTIKKTSGVAWHLSEMANARIWLSGPTANYQRVYAQKTDVVTRAVVNADGSYTYTFDTAIPATYVKPLNGSNGVGTDNRGGQALVDGPYTVAMSARWNYTVDGSPKSDFGNTTKDILLGATAVASTREVVKGTNCNTCHVTVQAHGGNYKDVAVCVTCHTAGAMDKPTSGTIGTVPIEFKVMIHKIHNGAHLPSVNGVSVDSSGNRDYTAIAAPYEIIGYGNSVNDFSHVAFPVFPSFSNAMPKNAGYSTLSTTIASGQTISPRTKDDNIRKGVVACYKCHGDPDGAGTKTAPSQGAQHTANPSRRACGACHDDIDWTKPYIANGMTMPPQADDVSCATCHAPTGTTMAQGIAVTGGTLPPNPLAHVHPMADGTRIAGVEIYTTGVNFSVSSMSGNAAAYFVAGEKPAITFTVKDDAGVDIPLYKLSAISTTLAGPTDNRQLVFPMNGPKSSTIPVCDFSGRLVATSTTNKGSMSRVIGSSASDTLKVQFTSATAFTVTAGSAATALGGSALPASPSTNTTGTSLSAVELTSAAVVQTITVNFSTSTAFAVTGSVSGGMGSGTMPAATSASTRFTSTDGSVSFTLTSGTTAFGSGNNIYMTVFQTSANNHKFAIVAGRTAFASGDRFYYETVDNAQTSYTYNLPMDMFLEFVGDGVTGVAGEIFTAANLPVYWGRETVYERTAMAGAGQGNTTLSAASSARGRYVDLTGVTNFAANDYVVLDHGTAGAEEYARIGTIIGTRAWFTTPLRYAHAAGVTCQEVTLTAKLEASNYTLNPTTGVITSVSAITAGNAVVVSYRTQGAFGWYRHNGDARQDVYPPPMNDSPDLAQDWGEWQGLPYQSGTYTAAVWGSLPIYVTANNETQTYALASVAALSEFRYGSAGSTTAYPYISSQDNCANCHDGIFFHGGSRKGNDTCVMCHGVAGGEDWPAYGNGAASISSPGLTIRFSNMLHKIHMGEELSNASAYTIVGNNGSSSTFEEISFPAMPGKVKHCETCHGAGTSAWKEPAVHAHAGQTTPTRNWKTVCNSCHDAAEATTHIDAMTTSAGAESCVTCHGTGQAYSVETVHKNR